MHQLESHVDSKDPILLIILLICFTECFEQNVPCISRSFRVKLRKPCIQHHSSQPKYFVNRSERYFSVARPVKWSLQWESSPHCMASSRIHKAVEWQPNTRTPDSALTTTVHPCQSNDSRNLNCPVGQTMQYGITLQRIWNGLQIITRVSICRTRKLFALTKSKLSVLLEKCPQGKREWVSWSPFASSKYLSTYFCN